MQKPSPKACKQRGFRYPHGNAHRSIPVAPPYQHRGDTRQARKEEGRRNNAERRGLKVRAASEVRQGQSITRRRLSFLAPCTVRCPPFRVSVARQGSRGRSPSRHRCAGGGWVEPGINHGTRAQGGRARSEIRSPKAERRPKSETRRSGTAVVECRVFRSPTQRGPGQSTHSRIPPVPEWR